MVGLPVIFLGPLQLGFNPKGLNSNIGTKTLIGLSPKAFEQPLSWWNPPCFAGLPAANRVWPTPRG
jgi:hypothetical protein